MQTALGPDALAVRSISVQEELSRLFRIEADLRSTEGEVEDIDFDKVVGHNATIRLELGQKKTRYFNGFVSRFVQVGNLGRFARYRATVVPWLWFLPRTADCRIFQNKTIPEILEEVFKGHGFNDYKLSLSGSYEKREYCVQYLENDFNFVSRLMEQEGIYYFFRHEDGKHTIVLADSISAHDPSPGYEEVPFLETDKAAPGHEAITEWSVAKEVQPVAYALNDFDFEKPKVSLLSASNKTREHGAAHFEVYEYPGAYAKTGEGERLAEVRLQELQTQFETLHGETTARGLAPGSTFKLTHHPRKDQNREYLITGVSLHVDAGDYASLSASQKEEGEFFSCSFSAIDRAQQFRPARNTPRPVMQGPQTAIVAGKEGEELYVDKYGRVKLQFHWDRYGKADENSSCWVRVAQTVAGKHWGSVFLPRIGQEVVVEFLEGDPDRPLITGRVYNAVAMPPYDLPAKASISTLKSNSSKGGQGFNEIRFEDKKDEEQIFVHGEKNLDVRIKNDTFEWVGENRHLVVKKDQIEHVENDRDETVDADHKEKIGKDRHLKVVGKEAKAVDGSQSLTVKGDVTEVFKASHSEQTTNDYYLKAENVCIEAATNLTLKVGQTTVAMEAGGVGIKTTGEVKIESTGPTEIKATGPLKLESSATADVKSITTSIKGDATVIVQGGLVKIN